MTQTLEAKTLSLNEVHRFLKLEEREGGAFIDWLSLEPLSEFEQQELLKIRNNFRRYLAAGKVSEGLVKLLTLAPLMRLTGFYEVPLWLSMEDSIVIEVEDEDKKITGRLDIMAFNNELRGMAELPLWILVVEAKNSAIDALVGLPQLLTYAFKSLDRQSSVWGLTTNGQSYRFVYIKRGNPSTYQILSEVNLIDLDRAFQLVQILKAICKLQAVQLQVA